jgi:hypothetical protein
MDWQNWLDPQQATVPSIFTPQKCPEPALTEAKGSFAAFPREAFTVVPVVDPAASPPGKAATVGAPSGFVGTGERWVEQDAAAAAARNKAI